MEDTNQQNSLLKFSTSMEENIDSMENLMTLFDCDLAVLEYVILQLGHCYYYNKETFTVEDGNLRLTATNAGDIRLVFSNPDSPTIKHRPLDAYDVYLYISKDEEDCYAILDAMCKNLSENEKDEINNNPKS